MRILVVDDHPLIQVALQHVLEELDAELELFQAHDARAARDVLSVLPQIDLIMLDLTLPGCDGFDYLRELRDDWPGIPVLVLSATHDRATIEAALDMGAMGFIPKTANSQLLLGAHAPRACRRRLRSDRKQRLRRHPSPSCGQAL